MTTATLPDYSINPKLEEALERVVKAGQSAIEDINLLVNASTPVRDMLQLNSQVMGLYKGLDWANLTKNIFDPSSYSEPIKSLAEIQQAAFKKLSDGQNQLVSTVAKDGQDFFQSNTDIEHPQEAVALCIDKSLDAYDNLKNELQDQVQTVSSIQSAYLAWFQQTLTTMGAGSKKKNSAPKTANVAPKTATVAKAK